MHIGPSAENRRYQEPNMSLDEELFKKNKDKPAITVNLELSKPTLITQKGLVSMTTGLS